MTTASLLAAVQVVHRYRVLARRNPARTAAHLRQHLTLHPSAHDPLLDVDLRLLLAEIRLRLRDPAAAVNDGGAAADAAARLDPVNWPRLIIAFAVGADVAVCAGHPQAMAACDGHLAALVAAGQVDPRRTALGHALKAVAVYHHASCGQGLQQLEELNAVMPAGSPYATMLRFGFTAMRDRCGTRAHVPFAGPVPSLPGGVLTPSLDHPAEDFLSVRVNAPAMLR